MYARASSRLDNSMLNDHKPEACKFDMVIGFQDSSSETVTWNATSSFHLIGLHVS